MAKMAMLRVAEFEIYDTKEHDSINKIGHFYFALTLCRKKLDISSNYL